MKRCLSTGLKVLASLAFAFLVFAGSAQAGKWKELPQMSITITMEDVLKTKEGQEVKELNDRLRKIAEKADRLKKEEDSEESVALLKAGFDELKQERDRVGEPIRGLVGLNLILLGDLALKNKDILVQKAVEDYVNHGYSEKGQVKNNTIYGYYSWSRFSSENENYPSIALDPPSDFWIRWGKVYEEEGPTLELDESGKATTP
jgi:hypothetical protein